MQISAANSLQSNCDNFEKSTIPEENKTFVSLSGIKNSVLKNRYYNPNLTIPS